MTRFPGDTRFILWATAFWAVVFAAIGGIQWLMKLLGIGD